MNPSGLKALTVPVGVGATTAGMCLFVPTLHTLTHEFTTLFTIVSFILLYFRGTSQEGSALNRATLLSVGLADSLFWALAMGSAAIAVLFVANAIEFHCRLWTGLPYFLLTWGPATLLAITLGALSTRLRWRITIFIILVCVDLLHDGLQLYFGPRVFPVDLILGDLAAFSQRGDMNLSIIHLRHAVVPLSTAFIAWQMTRWRLLRRREDPDGRANARTARAYTIAALLFMVGLIVLGGSYIGVGISRLALERECPLVSNQDSVIVHYSDAAGTLERIDAIIRESQWQYHFLTRALGITPTNPVHVYVLESPEVLQEHTGIAFAHAGIREVFLNSESALDSTLRHEMMHALHKELDPSPLILLNRGLLEGTAMAFEKGYTVLPEFHDLQAAALRAGKLPRAETFMSIGGFGRIFEGSAYHAAGSFLGFLVLRYGTDPFLSFQHRLNYAQAYGKDLDALDDEWREFLSDIPARDDVKAAASQYFDADANPSYISADCPKVGSIPDTREVLAQRYWNRGEYIQAGRLYQEIYEESGAIRWAIQAARCQQEDGDNRGALALILSAANRSDLKDFEAATLMAQRVRLLVILKDWQALYETYDERASGAYGVGPSMQMGEACLRNPQIREMYASLFSEQSEPQLQRIWDELLEQWPEFAPLGYVYATVVLQQDEALQKRVDAVLDLARRSQQMADLVAPNLVSLYKESVAEREYESASELCEALVELCKDARFRYLGRVGHDRIIFERETAPLTL